MPELLNQTLIGADEIVCAEKRAISFETLKRGDGAFAVLKRILEFHPEVYRISLCFYPKDNYEAETGASQLVWLPVEIATEDNLRMLSSANFKAGRNLMALGSKVDIGYFKFMHIQQMNFAVCKKPISEELRLSVFGRNTPGALLSTGESYHYWGARLLTEDEFCSDLQTRLIVEKRRKTNKELPLYDEKYIEESLKRGFTALRLFGYLGIKDAPEIVGLS